MIVVVVLVVFVIIIIAGKSTKTRNKEANWQTHFTCVEKINVKRLKKQLPHKLRSTLAWYNYK